MQNLQIEIAAAEESAHDGFGGTAFGSVKNQG